MADANDVMVRFPAEQMEALKEAVAEGSYQSESELLAEAFEHWSLDRMLNNPTERQKRVMRRLWDEGIASGPAVPFDIEEIKRKGRERLAARSKRG